MTSSLVGSEMCIRDSMNVTWHSRKKRHANKFDEATCEAPSYIHVLRTVSYTHLTLPTICSV
eukprot:3177803-Prorocentrum_lima.AAC.1